MPTPCKSTACTKQNKEVFNGYGCDGRNVRGLRVAVNYNKLEDIINQQRERPGILEILVQINADRKLQVGDDVMYLVVAGDVRENVLAALTDTLNAIKTTVTQKTEFFTE